PPRLLGPELELLARPDVRIAGLLTGVEGYIESCAMGMLAAWFVAARLRGHKLAPPPPTTALGGLYQHVARPRAPGEAFAPTNINFGLLPPVPGRVKKRARGRLVAERAERDLEAWLTASRLAAACSPPPVPRRLQRRPRPGGLWPGAGRLATLPAHAAIAPTSRRRSTGWLGAVAPGRGGAASPPAG